MGWKNTHGLRGAVLEELVNESNFWYRKRGLGLVQKIPTPVKTLAINKGIITKAFYEEKSTVDYIGVIQGNAICFDAKECKTDTFPLANIHTHQLEFMNEFAKQDGIAFILLRYSHRDENYLIPLEDINAYFERSKTGRKSFRYDEVNKKYPIVSKSGVPLHYLEPLNVYIKDIIALSD